MANKTIDEGIATLLKQEKALIEEMCSGVVNGARMSGDKYNELANVQKDIKLLVSYASHRKLISVAN